ncbi:cysteine desulfurase family protein [Komagataeibacter rhaeticus]|uniref:Cysteine desulfurase n=1 Tax=Komagataeibacter rhaeticus TaxID=215221 RepID=A0A181C7N4_9PROT|nr:cysteine desulfurase family protein [Komagataeibacter rhaeticus]ATU74448.1 cysteine desulfurase [Komagataeibacter xylinus]QIP34528.1 cysteine desulfurase [Komagataeibacter rhaeticus]QOC47046.1 cysteine desulfurase [Komagataeibacter rhaeticus]WPP20618.1 cysteine desulfurase family protein [Komagataeibacter rhaeticus]SAY47577.1 Cysteine desulfurase [Komagataeibacter rhaeticus]
MSTARDRFTYLDANASEPIRPQALAAMTDAAEAVGNPASVHRAGRAARALLETAREDLATIFGVQAENCIFTSGGTEANVLAITGQGQGRRIMVGATEHDAVRQAAPGQTIPVTADGVVDGAALERLLAVPGAAPALVCVMLANNETGVISPVREIADLCHAHGALLHVDAVQAAGRIGFDMAGLGADSIALSGHKFGGPKGAGALLLAGERFRALTPLLAGGGQEQGRRGGTPALPAIAGMVAAARAALAAQSVQAARLGVLRDRIERAATPLGAVVCGAAAPRLANTTCLLLPGRRAQTQLIALDMAGYGVSAGSACSSGKVARSHVLDAMGLGEGAGCAIRVSLPWSVTEADVDGFIAAYAAMVARLPARPGVVA